jgi:glucose-1-phosphate adenylyltransferase
MANHSKSTVAVILGGGAGTRLHPLTASRSKPAVPIAGKYRLVDIPISNCINNNISRMFVLTQYNSASLNRHIKNTYHFSAFGSGFVDILAAEQTPDNQGWFQGTADAVRQSLRHISAFAAEYILILSGDQLYQMDLNAMLTQHCDSGADITIATQPVVGREASEFGILKADDNNMITSFIEKPKQELLPEWVSETNEEMKAQGRYYLASMGIYVFNAKLLNDLLNNTMKDATDFGKQILPESIGTYKVASYQYGGYWTDIGNIYSFYEANLALTDPIPPFNLFDNTNTVYTRPRMLPPAKFTHTVVEKSIVAEGSIIHADRISGSVIGIRSRIGKQTEIKDSYLMGNDYYETLEQLAQNLQDKRPAIGIGERCYIEHAIIDKDCRIGNDVRIVGGGNLENKEHELYTIKDNIIVVKKNAVVPDGFRIE